MDEFSLIETYFAGQAAQPLQETLSDPNTGELESVAYGIGDDCAVLNIPHGCQLVVSTDSLVENTHFLSGSPPELLAWRLVGSSVSDLAAMGARPLGYTLALTLPESSEDWLKPFSEGLHQASSFYQIPLVGGDTTRGPLTLTATVHGSVEKDRALLRNSAQPGDLICVTGTLGDSRAGLELVFAGKHTSNHPDESYLLDRFYKPQARLVLGQQISRLASSCIDLSDGLSSDLTHIIKSSGVGAEVDLITLPLSYELQRLYPEEAEYWALNGGEDFELCFTLPQNYLEQVNKFAVELGVRISVIGKITAGAEFFVIKGDQKYPLESAGFKHFE